MSIDNFENTTDELQRLASAAEPAVRHQPGTATTVLRRARRARLRLRIALGSTGLVVAGALAAGNLIGHSRYFEYVQPSEAMSPTIAVGEIVTIDKSLTPRVGDVVLARISSNGETITALFRYAGDATHPIPSERLAVSNHGPAYYTFAQVDSASVTPAVGRVALFGDNIDNARDSRYFGFIDARDIEGVAIRIREAGGHERPVPSAPAHAGSGSDVVDPPAEVPTTSSVTP